MSGTGDRAGSVLSGLRIALGRLREAASTAELEELAARETARCGFARGSLTRIEGSAGRVVAFHVDGDPEAGAALLAAAGRAPLRLDHLVLETELLRRRAPLLVVDLATVHPPILRITGTRGYVAAAVVADGAVQAFLHADRPGGADELDREVLGILADGTSAAWERILVEERLQALRRGVRRDHASLLAIMDEVSDSGVEVARVDEDSAQLAQSAAAMFATSDLRLERLLTPRELEVMKLMAIGETNAAIAAGLVVSQGTVKSHVKHILRKLRAKNRAEAVSRYITLSQKQRLHEVHGS